MNAPRAGLARSIFVLALAGAAAAPGQAGSGGGFQAGLLAGLVVDPSPFGIEQVYGTAGLIVGWHGPVGVSLRPALLFGAGTPLLRVPLVLSLPLCGGGSGPGLDLTAGIGAVAWADSGPPRVLPILSAGIDLAVGPALVTAAASAVTRETGPDLIAELVLGWVFSRR